MEIQNTIPAHVTLVLYLIIWLHIIFSTEVSLPDHLTVQVTLTRILGHYLKVSRFTVLFALNIFCILATSALE